MAYMGGNWKGDSYRAYQADMTRLYSVNPVAQQYAKNNAPKEWLVHKASVPYTNTPNRASSMFVSNIRYLPYSQTAFVRLGNSQYWYNMTPRQMANWLCSNSLGRYYNNYMKLS